MSQELTSFQDNRRKIIRALYILNGIGCPLRELIKDPFVFSDPQVSLDLAEFLNIYLVNNGKSKYSNTSF